LRLVSPAFFSVLGVRLTHGREFTEADRSDGEPVAIINQSLAQRYFPGGEALNRQLVQGIDAKPVSRRIVGVVVDVDDETIDGQPAPTIYQPIQQRGFGGRLFVRAAGDPHALVPAVTRLIREIAPDQPVERAATLQEVRDELLSPERVNALVFSGFAGIALLIAVVGIAGVLAFSVSARTREFGMRLAVGCSPRALLKHVLSQGTAMAVIGIAAGAVGGFILSRVASSFFTLVRLPGALALMAAAAVLLAAAVAASWLPAARAARIDVIEALRSE
jgi:putative ABC transport system permease protein